MEANGGYGSNLTVHCEGDRRITDIMRGIDTALAEFGAADHFAVRTGYRQLCLAHWTPGTNPGMDDIISNDCSMPGSSPNSAARRRDWAAREHGFPGDCEIYVAPRHKKTPTSLVTVNFSPLFWKAIVTAS